MTAPQEPRVRRRTRDVPDSESAELARQYRAGATLLALLEGFDGSYRILRTVLKREGVQFRPKLDPELASAPPGMVAAYEGGNGLVETGAMFGVSPYVARRMLIQAGVTIRGKGRPRRRRTDATG